VRRALIRDSFLYVAARLCPGVFGVVTTAALTRLLEPEEYGVYALALVIMTLGSSVAFEWLGLSLLRFYQARREDPKLIPTFTAMFLLLAIVTGFLFGFAWLGGLVAADKTQILIVGLILVWTASWFELVSKMAIAEFQPFNYLLMSFGRSGFTLLGACGGAWLTGSPIWAALGTAAGSLAATFLIRTRLPLASIRRFDPNLVREIVRFGVPVAISMTLFGLTVSGSRLLIQQLDSTAALGLFTAASILAQNTLGVIGTGVSSAGYSMAVRALERESASMARRQLTDNATLLLAVLAPASLGMALTANSLATTVVGPKFASGVSVLIPWMAACSFFQAVRANHLDHSFQLGLKPNLQILVSFATSFIAISLCFYLIPQKGALGAAIALTIAAVVGCVLASVVGRYAYPIPLPIRGGVRIAASCALMAAAVMRLPDSGWAGLILRVGVGAAVYVLAAILFNVANIRDRFLSSPQLSLMWQAATSRVFFRGNKGA
jgi:O-antigen/teichoic acid export membrane protein